MKMKLMFKVELTSKFDRLTMKNLLFFTAIVLFGTRALEAVPHNIERPCSSCGNGGGTGTVHYTNTVEVPSTITYSSFNTNNVNSGNFNFGNGNGALTVTNSISSNDYNSKFEKLKSILANSAQSGRTVTTRSSSGKGEYNNDNGQRGKSDNNEMWNVALNFDTKNVDRNCKTCNHEKNSGHANVNCDKHIKDLMEALTEIVTLKIEINELKNANSQQQQKLDSLGAMYEQCDAKLKISDDTNKKLELRIENDQITITNLNKKVTQLTTELSHTNAMLSFELEKCKENVERIDSEMKKTLTETTGRATKCEESNRKLNIEILSLRKTLAVTQTDLSNCEDEKEKLEDKSERWTKEADEDKVKDAKMVIALEQCKAGSVKIEQNYMNQIEILIKNQHELTNKMTTTTNNYETTIKNLEASRKSETDQKNSCIIESKKCELKINDLTKQLKLLQQTYTQSQSDNKKLQEAANTCEKNIKILQLNLDSTTSKLLNCGKDVSSIQSELKLCQSDREKCITDLHDYEALLNDAEHDLEQCDSENVSLKTGLQLCEQDLGSLRCDTNKMLENVRQSLIVAKNHTRSAIDDVNSSLSKLIDFNDKDVFPCNK